MLHLLVASMHGNSVLSVHPSSPCPCRCKALWAQVRFTEATAAIPADVLLLEVGPHLR